MRPTARARALEQARTAGQRHRRTLSATPRASAAVAKIFLARVPIVSRIPVVRVVIIVLRLDHACAALHRDGRSGLDRRTCGPRCSKEALLLQYSPRLSWQASSRYSPAQATITGWCRSRIASRSSLAVGSRRVAGVARCGARRLTLISSRSFPYGDRISDPSGPSVHPRESP
jgi:hypothetical protein